MAAPRKPRLAVIKFASCDGCQLSLLDCEDELLAVAGAVEIANFPEASRAVIKGPYDLTLVEGSITTPHDAERIHAVRRVSKVLVTIGACATAGGIQALRNFAEVGNWVPLVYANPEYIHTLETSTPDLAPRQGGLRAAAAARSTSTSCSRWSGVRQRAAPVLPSHRSASTASGAASSA